MPRPTVLPVRPTPRPTTLPRTVHVEHCMGTAFTLDMRDPGNWRDAIAEVVGWLHRVDELFSTYRADSEISRLGHGELELADADPLVALVLERCTRIAEISRGYFSASPGGRLDPS